MHSISGSDDNGASGDALTLEALRQGLRLRSDLAAWFIKDIGRTEGSQGHSVVDIWVLFCLHANQDTSKKVHYGTVRLSYICRVFHVHIGLTRRQAIMYVIRTSWSHGRGMRYWRKYV